MLFAQLAAKCSRVRRSKKNLKKILESYSTRSAEKENAARWSGVHGG
jgi:hypothetical protein